jgi:hypothetical protein
MVRKGSPVRVQKRALGISRDFVFRPARAPWREVPNGYRPEVLANAVAEQGRGEQALEYYRSAALSSQPSASTVTSPVLERLEMDVRQHWVAVVEVVRATRTEVKK